MWSKDIIETEKLLFYDRSNRSVDNLSATIAVRWLGLETDDDDDVENGYDNDDDDDDKIEQNNQMKA